MFFQITIFFNRWSSSEIEKGSNFTENCIFFLIPNETTAVSLFLALPKRATVESSSPQVRFLKSFVAVCITPRDHNSPFRELEARWICFSKPFKTDFWPGYKSLVGRTIRWQPKGKQRTHIAIKMDSKLFKTRGVLLYIKVKEEWE